MDKRIKKLNILHVIGGLSVGGAERLLIDLIKHLDRKEFNVYVCYVMKGQNQLEKEILREGVEVFSLDKKRKTLGIIPLLRIIKIIKKKKIDIIHTHLFAGDMIGRFGGLVTKGTVIISTKHNTTFNEKRYFHRPINKWLARIATDKLIAVSKDVKAFCVKADKVDSKKITIIYNGVNLSKYNGIQFSKNQYPILGTVASLTEQKGHKFLIEAMLKVRIKYPQIKLWLIGDGILRHGLEMKCDSLRLRDNVFFLGNRDDVPELLKKMDLFVLPSLWEGLPIALIEASAAGLPVIATKVSGSVEAVIDGKTGILVPPGDSSALSSAIIWILENREKAEHMGKMGREWIKKHFDIKSTSRKYEELYKEIYKHKIFN